MDRKAEVEDGGAHRVRLAPRVVVVVVSGVLVVDEGLEQVPCRLAECPVGLRRRREMEEVGDVLRRQDVLIVVVLVGGKWPFRVVSEK